MKDKFTIEISIVKDVPIMYLKGDITILSDEQISRSYKSIEFQEKPKLVIDFTDASYINSAGIASLVGIVADMVEKKGTLRFSGLAPHYQRIVKIVGITEYVDLYSSTEEALAEV